MSVLVTSAPLRPTVLTALRTAASCGGGVSLPGVDGLVRSRLARRRPGLEMLVMTRCRGCRDRLGVLRRLVVGAELDEILRAPALPPDGVEEVLVGAAEVEFLGMVE